jgi:tetratricopeptide (TPR) repeat protein
LFSFSVTASDTDSSAAARRAFWEDRARHQKDPHDAQASWQFARACFDLAEVATNSTERAAVAEQGIAAARQLIAGQPNSAPGHYYLGMDLAQLARTRGLSALKIVDQMEQEFKMVRELDEHLDHAGADRNLGLLYRDAPSLGSIGSRSKARQHLQSAVALAPDFPENRLNLIESCIKWNDRNGALRELKALEDIWPSALAKYSEPRWAGSWTDWNQRLAKVKKKIGEPSKTLEAPSRRD